MPEIFNYLFLVAAISGLVASPFYFKKGDLPKRTAMGLYLYGLVVFFVGGLIVAYKLRISAPVAFAFLIGMACLGYGITRLPSSRVADIRTALMKFRMSDAYADDWPLNFGFAAGGLGFITASLINYGVMTYENSYDRTLLGIGMVIAFIGGAFQILFWLFRKPDVVLEPRQKRLIVRSLFFGTLGVFLTAVYFNIQVQAQTFVFQLILSILGITLVGMFLF